MPETVPITRRLLSGFAGEAGLSPDRVDSVALAASEAVTNVVRHAYSTEAGLVHVTAAVAGRELWVLIGDDGHGLEAGSDQPGLGMGLALIASVTDHFAVVKRSSGGTELRMQFRIDGGCGSERVRQGYQPRGSVASARSAA